MADSGSADMSSNLVGNTKRDKLEKSSFVPFSFSRKELLINLIKYPLILFWSSVNPSEERTQFGINGFSSSNTYVAPSLTAIARLQSAIQLFVIVILGDIQHKAYPLCYFFYFPNYALPGSATSSLFSCLDFCR